MAGFNAGASAMPNQKSNTAESRRKHRFVFTHLGDVLSSKELVYLQKASRPSFKFEEVKMHHDQERAYFAGQHEWEPVPFTWYDIEQDPDVSARLWDWLASVMPNIHNISVATCVNPPAKYKKLATLEMTGNCDSGVGEETWTFFGMWPREVKWNELDFEANEILRIDVQGRFDRAIRGKI